MEDVWRGGIFGGGINGFFLLTIFLGLSRRKEKDGRRGGFHKKITSFPPLGTPSPPERVGSQEIEQPAKWKINPRHKREKGEEDDALLFPFFCPPLQSSLSC